MQKQYLYKVTVHLRDNGTVYTSAAKYIPLKRRYAFSSVRCGTFDYSPWYTLMIFSGDAVEAKAEAERIIRSSHFITLSHLITLKIMKESKNWYTLSE